MPELEQDTAGFRFLFFQGDKMLKELKTILKKMKPKRTLKWFWKEYVRTIRSEQEISYNYFSNMMNDFCKMWPEIEITVRAFIEKNSDYLYEK